MRLIMDRDDIAPPATLTPVRRVSVVRSEQGRRIVTEDATAAEEPLDVRLHGQSFAVIMRTPGDDQALAAGFLYAERVIRSPEDIGAVEHCRHPDRTEAHHVVNVFLAGDAARHVQDHLEGRRRVLANSSCGVCGRASIEELRADLPPLTAAWSVRPSIVTGLPDALRARQAHFDETGGLHAAASSIATAPVVSRARTSDATMRWTRRSGGCCSMMCAVDRQHPDGERPVSFEIVKKAWTGGIPVVAAVSAPTSLAVELTRGGGSRSSHSCGAAASTSIRTKSGSTARSPHSQMSHV